MKTAQAWDWGQILPQLVMHPMDDSLPSGRLLTLPFSSWNVGWHNRAILNSSVVYLNKNYHVIA